jgi:hypothetical protein
MWFEYQSLFCNDPRYPGQERADNRPRRGFSDIALPSRAQGIAGHEPLGGKIRIGAAETRQGRRVPAIAAGRRGGKERR